MARKRKAWTNAKKITFNGITFDSTMECEMYKLLKKSKVKFKYIGKERAKYTVLEEEEYQGGCYERAQKRSKELKDNPKITKAGYTPDFCGENEEWFIEVKGRKLGDFNLKWKLFKKILMKRKPQPILFMPVTKQDCENVIRILKEKGYARN